MEFMAWMIILFVLLGALALGGIGYYFFMKIRYRTASSNEALIITGPKLGEGDNVFSDEDGRSLKIIRGGGHLLRRFQTATPVPLTSFQLQLTTPRIYADGGVPIQADAVAMVKVADGLKGIAIYAEQFLGKDQGDVEKEIKEVLESNLRAILSKMSVEQINADREAFNEQVMEVAQKQLDDMGFKITSLGLTDLRDDEENGYLENLGRPQIAKVRKEAEIAEAESERETRMHKAKTDQEAKQEEYERQKAISESKKSKEIQEAEFKRETEQARAKSEQSYDLEKARLEKEVEQEKLDLARRQKEEELNLNYMEQERAVQLEEEQSKVRQQKADAEYYETTKRAEAEAERARIEGEADAHVIKERGVAEAEARRLLAKAMEEHGEAIIKEQVVQMLPELAEKIAAPMSNIDSVKVIDSGSGDGVPSVARNTIKTMTDLQEPIKEIAGVDIGEIVNSLAAKGKDTVADAVNNYKAESTEDTAAATTEASDSEQEEK
ncbi:flotillin [Salsuginibacillus halophilus]|uniref:Flotillin n=1 Tax=Salsuginibacillus halophilus TaxID=517424 RepID=A0A2P8H9N8_9BACI|nr:SPFH domain-containing protein [Salsuginibacillus halophilus]PSL42924.1 flotillin [Salsuginibacillus halophilus]